QLLASGPLTQAGEELHQSPGAASEAGHGQGSAALGERLQRGIARVGSDDGIRPEQARQLSAGQLLKIGGGGGGPPRRQGGAAPDEEERSGKEASAGPGAENQCQRGPEGLAVGGDQFPGDGQRGRRPPRGDVARRQVGDRSRPGGTAQGGQRGDAILLPQF